MPKQQLWTFSSMLKKNIIKNFTIDTPEKYWAVIFGYHIHKGVLGVILIIIGIVPTLNLYLRFALIFIGIGIVILDTIGHIHTNWHKTFSLIEKHNGAKYKNGGYKKTGGGC